jgi:putative spermidine/putrescine transport system permease protein
MARPVERTPLQILVRWSVPVISVLACIFLVAPLVVFPPLSLNSGSFFRFPLDGLSLRWYEDLLSSTLCLGALHNSLFVGAMTTVLSLLIGVPAAFVLRRMRSRGKGLLFALLLSPMIVPVIITGVAASYVFGPLRLSNSYVGLILSHTAIAVPFVLIAVSASLSGFNPVYLRAGASLGAPPLLVFRRIMLPLIASGVVSGALFAFAASFDDVVIALFIAGPEQRTLPRQMMIASIDGFRLTITAAATFMTFISILLMIVIELLKRRSRRMTA